MEKKRHHYISQTYLRGFSSEDKEPFRVAGFNLKENRSIAPSNPLKLGVEKYFNQFEAEGVDPQCIEDGLSHLEGKIRPAIQEVEGSGTLEGNARQVLIETMALFSIRLPRVRSVMDGHKEKVLNLCSRRFFDEYPSWERAKDYINETGCPISDERSFEYLKSVFTGAGAKIKFPREEAIALEFKILGPQIERLAARNWSVIRTETASTRFITSDNPVVIDWNDREKIPPLYRQCPGFGLGNTFVYFPLNQSTALLGEWEREEVLIDVDEQKVAMLNACMIHNADNFLFFPGDGFKFLGKSGEIFQQDDLADQLSQLQETTNSASVTYS